MSGDIFDVADKVESFQDFLNFMSLLEADFLENGSLWENQTIGNFIEASAGWAADEAKTNNTIKNPSWRSIARILSAGIIYE